jgi:hypothetical protein
MEKKLFLFIQSVLIGNTSIKHFDWFNNQPYDPTQHESFKKPAAFLRIMPFDTKTYGQNRQIANITFELIIVQEQIKPMNKIAGTQAQQTALKHLEFMEEIFVAMHGSGDTEQGIANFLRTKVTPDHDFTSLIIHSHTYTTRITDDSAVKQTELIPENTPIYIDPITVQT